MGRHKYRVRPSRDSGLTLPKKRDTPVKPAMSRRGRCRRLLSNKHYEAFPEEPEGEEINFPTERPTHPVLTSIKPVHCKSVIRLSSTAFTANPRDKAFSPVAPANKKCGYRVSPAGHPPIQMTPEPEAFKGGEMPVNEEEENLTVTPESITSSSMGSDTTFNSDDEDEEASSSLPSPEIFRRESYVETLTFPIEEELLDFHLHMKNSTLLDVSHAEGIHMFHPLNLSNIIDASTILAEKNSEKNGAQSTIKPVTLKDSVRTEPEEKNRRPEAEAKIHTDSFKSAKAFKWKTPQKLINRRPLLYKKKVWFKSPIITETLEAKHTPATKLNIHNAGEPAHTSNPAEQKQPDADTSRAGEVNSKEEELRLMLTLKRPVKRSLEKAKFFDFIDDSDRDAFFKRMRDRCVKLRSAPLFPLSAPQNLLSCDI